MKIIIDCRKIFDSGIGTYIYNTIPGVIKKLQELPNIDISILVFKNDYCRLYQLFPLGINFIKVNYKNFSLREQIYINRLIERDSYFWATSLNYPIFIKKNFLISTVYDLIPITIKSRSYLERIIFYLLYWNISKKSQLILFISKFIQNQFIECFNYSGRSKVTYLGVGSDWFVNVTEKEKYIISYCLISSIFLTFNTS